MEPDPTAPSDAPLSEVVDRLAAAGYAGQFQAQEGGTLLCLTCRESFDASTAQADQVTRLEGASDPADMAIVVPLRCPHCETGGALVAHYGPESTEAESDVLAAFDRVPDEGSGGPGQAGISTPGNG